MARKKKLLETVKKRPPFFWWILANLLAGAFAVVSWTTCLYIFNYPEKPANYDLLRKLKRLTPVAEFTPLDSPDGDPANPQVAFRKFFGIEPKALGALNTRLRRDYITNFKDPKFVTYVEGDYRVTKVRKLTPNDFFHPGVVVRAQAFVQPDESNELNEPTDYPVAIELLLPTAEEVDPATFYKPGDTILLKDAAHRAFVLHATNLGTREEPLIYLTAVPLAYENYKDAKGRPLPLAPPDPVRISAPFPLMPRSAPAPSPAPPKTSP